ncbi:alpha/beta hydrolase family protein [Streptomyces bambusae]|uniref:Prolyl oligopeptidase family serine peptidase n=1 Tax=Streptomyces bambusae TaxID=1550616 RepID=A0ABS6Z204_9ACTN|nr:prolyl oligopeptidase family serine peptidase [Streptomyces bambusae]MBW5481278.1 prolyl oligopeptidase family serine peptidase [Streptomyces bambusae]
MPAELYGVWRRQDTGPDGRTWAELTFPAHPPVAERHPSPVHWRSLVLDPALAGTEPGRARPLRIALHTAQRPDDGWELPVTDVLPTPLAWHPRRPLVAGLSVHEDRSARPWIADLTARTVRHYPDVRAATSLTGPGRPPLAWLTDGRLALLTPDASRPAPADRPRWRAAVYEATGPGFVSFQPGPEELERVAAVRPATLEPGYGAVELLGPLLLVRALDAAPDGSLAIGHAHPSGVGPDEHGLRWATSRLHPSAPGRLVPVPVPLPDAPPPSARPVPSSVRSARRDRRSAARGASAPPPGGARPAVPPPPDAPAAVHSIPTGFAEARLTVLPGRAAGGPALLWIRALRSGEAAPGRPPHFLAAASHRAAVLDLPLHWPDDATPALLNGQITAALSTALRLLRPGTVAVGGHSFGATLALYALAQLPEPAGAVAHSGCYNRTSTPTGFHYERRTLWQAPDVYRAFSALQFADRLDRPVLVVHGADDANPATTPEQAVELYRAVVATGGTARLVLLPQEGHTFRSHEALEAVAGEHQAWLEKLETH